MQTNCSLQPCLNQAVESDLVTWSDFELIQYCSDTQNSDSAFTALMLRYRPWIFRRCLFRLGQHHDAEDVTQDIVMRVFTHLHQFQGRSQFKSWLNTIIDNHCNSFAKRNARYATMDCIEELIDLDNQFETPDPDCALTDKAVVQTVMTSLPENARQVLNLRFFADYSLAEIAQILSLTLSAAKARLYRALEQLQHLYQRVDEGRIRPCLV